MKYIWRKFFGRFTPPFSDEDGNEIHGSIAELRKFKINCVDQWLMIRGKDKSKPALLFLHGGPGTGAIFYARHYQQILEEYFVVVNWDQRGAGLSYHAEIRKQEVSIAQLIADTIEVTRTILQYLKKDKLYLVAHSWGTLLGTKAIQQAPELYFAYFGIGQVSDMPSNEVLVYGKIRNIALSRKDKLVLKQLEAAGKPPFTDWKKAIFIQRKIVHKYNGAMYKGNVMYFITKNLLRATEYSWLDKIRFLQAQLFSIRRLWKPFSESSLYGNSLVFEIPVYFFLGKYDLTILPELAEAYFDKITAPEKQKIWFRQSAHFIPMEEVEKYQQEIIRLANLEA